jgi:hypothetical protein
MHVFAHGENTVAAVAVTEDRAEAASIIFFS